MHLVLGGSYGLGRAYSTVKAEAGESLVLVARGRENLEEAQSGLVDAGASEVIVLAGDVLDSKTRSTIMNAIEPAELASVFVGGPSPPQGRFDELSSEDWRKAFLVCLEYPTHMLRWASEVAPHAEVLVVSSSTSIEEPCGHQFYLSAVFRRSLEMHCACLANTGMKIRILRPHVVLTPLAIQFAERLSGRSHLTESDAEAVLRSAFPNASVESANQFIRRSLALQ